jgi:Restriction endonuclease
MRINTGSYPALLLNADFSPLSVHPLSTLSWQDAIQGIFCGKFVAVAEYDMEVRSARQSFRLPSVVALTNYRKVPRHAAFTRANLWLREGGRCAYCRQPLPTQDLTFDHVLPKSRGGAATWENIVCACTSCNCRKGNRTPQEAGMVLSRQPRRPTQLELAKAARSFARSSPVPKGWVDFIYWDGELEAG